MTAIATTIHFILYACIVTFIFTLFAAINVEFVKEESEELRIPGRIRLAKVRLASKKLQRRAILTSSRSNVKVLCAGMSSILTEP